MIKQEILYEISLGHGIKQLSCVNIFILSTLCFTYMKVHSNNTEVRSSVQNSNINSFCDSNSIYILTPSFI